MIILTSILVLGLLGFIFASLLGLAADYLKVETDPRLTEIMAALPNTNCGACGSAGCRNFGEKLLAGKVAITGCIAGGQGVADQLAKIMGVAEVAVRPQVAAVHCGAKENQRRKTAKYFGIKNCASANLVVGGGLLCRYGCLGYGDCCLVCTFDALVMKDGLPVVDLVKCTGCGKCVDVCPRIIISLRPGDFNVVVACASKDRGAETRKICAVGCIGCKICEKEPPGIFKVVDNLAIMDYSQNPVNCQEAIAKCPPQCIVKL